MQKTKTPKENKPEIYIGKMGEGGGKEEAFSYYFYLAFELYHIQSLLLEVDAFLKWKQIPWMEQIQWM